MKYRCWFEHETKLLSATQPDQKKFGILQFINILISSESILHGHENIYQCNFIL